MIIAIDGKPKKSWGGGSHFVLAISESLKKEGHQVCFDLSQKVDAILVVFRGRKSKFGLKHISKYLKKYPKTVVVQRINNLDTHSNKGSVQQYKEYNQIAHATVFVSEWARSFLHKNKKLHLRNEHVITNDVRQSFRSIRPRWDRSGPIKLVTHHWSTNPSKGFRTYKNINDEWSADEGFRESSELMYIGRLPRRHGMSKFKIKTLRGEHLAAKLRSRHVYITASIKECGPYHIMEGLRSGLPVMYSRDGGSIAEYVGNCGLQYEQNKPIFKYIKRIRNDYDMYYDRIVARFSLDTPSMSRQYIDVIKQVRETL